MSLIADNTPAVITCFNTPPTETKKKGKSEAGKQVSNNIHNALATVNGKKWLNELNPDKHITNLYLNRQKIALLGLPRTKGQRKWIQQAARE